MAIHETKKKTRTRLFITSCRFFPQIYPENGKARYETKRKQPEFKHAHFTSDTLILIHSLKMNRSHDVSASESVK